jgi:hypothetical protein
MADAQNTKQSPPPAPSRDDKRPEMPPPPRSAPYVLTPAQARVLLEFALGEDPPEGEP